VKKNPRRFFWVLTYLRFVLNKQVITHAMIISAPNYVGKTGYACGKSMDVPVRLEQNKVGISGIFIFPSRFNVVFSRSLNIDRHEIIALVLRRHNSFGLSLNYDRKTTFENLKHILTACVEHLR
jgi:hypothetical protein